MLIDQKKKILRDTRQMFFMLSVMLMVGAFFVGSVLSGYRLLNAGYMWPPDLLFGCDIARNLRNISEPGYSERSNVHPLFTVVIKPFGLLIQRLGITQGVSAIIVNAAAGGFGLLLTAFYLRLRGLTRLDTLLVTLLMGSSAAWIVASTLPGTYLFSLCVIAASNLLLIWALQRPDSQLPRPTRWGREGLWLLTGVLNYGFTVTNGLMSFISYGFGQRGRKGWLRAIAYGALVLVIGLAASKLTGSVMNMWDERVWTYDKSMRGENVVNPLTHSISVSLAWTYVVPNPSLSHVPDQRTWDILTALHWSYTPLGWLLVTLWICFAGAAGWALIKDRDPMSQRLSLALILCLGFHTLLHTYYSVPAEGVFVFAPHALFLSTGLLAPLMVQAGNWRGLARWGLRLGILVFALTLAVRHFYLLHSIPSIIALPPGFGK